ncbi:MAG TPA: hypothetical protein PK440_10280 [Candidatus Accumulibacter phosphatis]|nr:MAG: hypothetical protein AW07_01553 [Candidatus Accumulibacter sp. SK-11]HRL78227.1 hypothetical protein [Candidatus Accumulibacter phosphatis]HRQ95364.1 hypothetical protein [Candidatus Accumulibacter phosphatis]
MADSKTIKLALAIAALVAAPAAFAYNDSSAQGDCVGKVAGWGSSYSHAHDVRVDETGYKSYNVTGLVTDRDGREHRFDCRVENREVVSWNVSQHRDHDHKKSDTGKALAIGAGVVGVAALIAVLASSKSSDAEHEEKRTTYSAGKESPFADMRYLRSECKRVLTAHLSSDHGDVQRLELTNSDLNGRTLSGDGSVTFERGGERNLTFSCAFDRAGTIYDGNYSYRQGGYR